MRSYSLKSRADLLTTSRTPCGAPSRTPAYSSSWSLGRGKHPHPGPSAGRLESPERGTGATFGGHGMGMLSRSAGLVSLGGRPRPPLPTAPHGRGEKRTFYLSRQSALSCPSLLLCFLSPHLGPVGAASVDLPGVRLGVGSDKSLPLASTGARAKRG